MVAKRFFYVCAGILCLALAYLLAVAECFAGPMPPPSNILYGFISSNRTLTYGPPGPIYDVIGDLVPKQARFHTAD